MAEEIFTSFNHEKIIECLTKQLSELELFQTMFSPREIAITNDDVIEDIKDFIDKKSDYTPNHLDYTITQCVDKLKLELSIHLPSMYPEIAPEIYVRCNQLNRQQEKSVNAELTAYLQSKLDCEVCIFTAITWLQDNVENFTIKAPTSNTPQSKSEQNFCRYWIYSHHIFCKKKVEEMMKLAKELNLTGFCLMGKPGVVCIEGDEADCKEGWKNIKTLNWQKIALRITETFNHNERAKQQKFKRFDIIKLDMGKFQKYIVKLGLLEQLNDFLGLCPTS